MYGDRQRIGGEVLVETVGEQSHPDILTEGQVDLDRFDDDGNPVAGGRHQVKPEEETAVKQMPVEVIDIAENWVSCNLCKSRIHIKFLDQHMKVHIYTAERKASSISSATQASSCAIVRIADQNANKPDHTESWSSLASAGSWSSKEKDNKPKLQSIETYKFRDLNNVCFAGSSSKSGRYSDFTIIFWTNECVSTTNSSYYGVGFHSNTTKDWERLQIHTVYDNLEDYYVVSCKLSRRSQYSSWDTDDCVPDQICRQHELLTTIKRALLFFRVSPKVAYKAFRKMMRDDEFIIDHEDGVAIAQTSNCEELNKKLKNSSTYTSTSSSSTSSMYGGFTDNDRGWRGYGEYGEYA